MNFFSRHPASVGETYFQHLGAATRFSVRLFGAGTACLLHGLFPFLFERTGSEAIKRLNEEMVIKRGGARENRVRAEDARSG